MLNSNYSTKETEPASLPSFVATVKNVLLCYGGTILCLLLFACVITYTDFPEQFAPGIVLVLTVLSVMAAGMITARGQSAKGWFIGCMSGLLYMVTLYCFGSLVFHSITFGANVITMLLLGALAGSFGGILGINMKIKRRKKY